MKNIVTISLIVFTLICCQNKIKNSNEKILTDTIHFPLRILPDNGLILILYPDSKYEYLYFSGFSETKTLENGSYKMRGDQILFTSEGNKSEFQSSKYFILKKNEISVKCDNCIFDRDKNYYLKIE